MSKVFSCSRTSPTADCLGLLYRHSHLLCKSLCSIIWCSGASSRSVAESCFLTLGWVSNRGDMRRQYFSLSLYPTKLLRPNLPSVSLWLSGDKSFLHYLSCKEASVSQLSLSHSLWLCCLYLSIYPSTLLLLFPTHSHIPYPHRCRRHPNVVSSFKLTW